MDVNATLIDKGIVLPDPPPPAANYIPYVKTGNLVFISGQVSQNENGFIKGVLGKDLKIEEGYDVVTASRYLDSAKSLDDDPVTAFGNWLFTKSYNILFQQNVTDYLVMYRAFKASIIDQLNVEHSSISWQSQLMCKAAKAGLKISEIPGYEPPRIGGERKMNPIRNGIAELKMLINEFIRKN